MILTTATDLAIDGLIAAPAIEFGRAKDGWRSSGPSRVFSLFAFPFLGAATAVPRPIRWGFLWAALAAPLAADVAIGRDAWWKGAAYFHRVWDRVPQTVIPWAVLWYGWQAIGLGILIAERRARRRENSES